MAYFHVSASWQTYAGNFGDCHLNIQCGSLEEAMAVAERVIRSRRKRSGVRGLNMSATAYPDGYTPTNPINGKA